MISMDQKKLTGKISLILCCVLLFSLSLSSGQSEENERTLGNSAGYLRTLLSQAQAYFFPPNLDFRGEGATTKEKMMEGGAPEDKLKEAVAESLEKTKSTVEDSARTAAKIVTETVKLSKEKLKRSVSDQQQEL